MNDRLGFGEFADRWEANARLALDTIDPRPTRGIPTWLINAMEWSHLDDFSDNPAGSYQNDPVRLYREFYIMDDRLTQQTYQRDAYWSPPPHPVPFSPIGEREIMLLE